MTINESIEQAKWELRQHAITRLQYASRGYLTAEVQGVSGRKLAVLLRHWKRCEKTAIDMENGIFNKGDVAIRALGLRRQAEGN